MLELIRNFMKKDEDGASAVEYGLLVAGIAALIVVIVFAFGGVIKGVFHDTFKGRTAGRPCCQADPAHQWAWTAGPRPHPSVSPSISKEPHHVQPTKRGRPSSTGCWSPASPH